MTNTLKAPKTEPEAPPLGSPLLRFYRSSLGKKLITGTTGIALVVFVLAHLAGNLLLFSGREAYNDYARAIGGLARKPGDLASLLSMGRANDTALTALRAAVSAAHAVATASPSRRSVSGNNKR